MNTYTGKIERVFKDMRNTRYGPKEATSFMIDGVKYGGGFKKYTVKEGDSVTIKFEDDGTYKNITDLSLAASAPTSSGAYKARSGRAAGEAGGFPLHPLAYERALDRRNALNAATTVLTTKASLEKDVAWITPETIIEMAKKFEAYTTGDEEREAAEKEFEAEKADPYNF